MSSRFSQRLFGLTLTLLLGLTAAAPAQTTLRFKFQEGETLEYVSDSRMKFKPNLGGAMLVITVDNVVHMTWTTQKVNADGSATVAIKIDRMVMNLEAPPPLGMATIDSADKKDPDNPLAQLLAKVVRAKVGQVITATISPLGVFSDVKIPKELQKGFKEATGGIEIGGGLEEMLGGGVVFPKDAVAMGKSWDHKHEAKTDAGNVSMEMKYTYEGTADNLEKIGVTPKMTIDPGKGGGASLKSKDGMNRGTVKFDNKAGRVVEINMTQFLTGALEAMGLSIPMDAELRTELKLKGRK